MKQPEYTAFCKSCDKAEAHAAYKNNGPHPNHWFWLVVRSPADQFSVVDIHTAIALGESYEYAA